MSMLWDPAFLRANYADGWWDQRTISEQVSARAGTSPSAVAIITESGDQTTWLEYDERATLVARAFTGLGLPPGANVAVMLPDLPALHVVWVGAERAGLTVVAIPKKAGAADVRKLIEEGRCAALVTLADHAAPGLEKVESLPVELRVDACGVPMDVPTGPPPSTALTADDLFLVNYTSGTTGRPKGVMHTQNRWKYQVLKCTHLTSSDIFLVPVPATGGFGLWIGHVTPAILGATAVYFDHFEPASTLAAIERFGVTVLACVPTQLRMLLEAEELQTVNLSTLRVVHLGGEAMPVAAARRFEAISGATVVQMYGSTESGLVSGPSPLDESWQHRLGTAGKPNAEMQVRLLDDDGTDVPWPGIGRPIVRGPGMSPGYFQDPEADAQLFTDDGWLRLGDVVEIDTEGYLHVVGRTSDFIIRGGLNISAVEIEEAVSAHPGVTQVAAVAMPDLIFGERACVYVVPAGDDVELGDITAFLSDAGMSKAKWPEAVINVPRMPLNAAGKIAKAELREDARKRAAHA